MSKPGSLNACRRRAGRWCLPIDSVDTEGGDMKIVRWFLGIVFLSVGVFLFLGTAPSRAATAFSTPTGCDEHPWDKLIDAYRVQVLIVTDEYILLAVWYTKDQVNPVLIWVKYQSHQRVAALKSGPTGRKSLTSFF